jgi:Ca-activated chloride channel homolog
MAGRKENAMKQTRHRMKPAPAQPLTRRLVKTLGVFAGVALAFWLAGCAKTVHYGKLTTVPAYSAGLPEPQPTMSPEQAKVQSWFQENEERARAQSSIEAKSKAGTGKLPPITLRALRSKPVELAERDARRQLLDPRSLPSRDEELWVIAKSSVDELPKPGDDTPGSGAMLGRLPQQEKEVPLPLKHTDVRASISAYIATVEVTQQFHNPYDQKIEAVYVFPLPHNAAVNEFVMSIGERRIRGIIRERQEAEQIYAAAKSQGHVASLLTQERPNIFTQSVANIEPGKAVDINIRYFNTLAYDDGWYEFVFPMVVGPRFNPPGLKDGVGAVGRNSTEGRVTRVPDLNTNEQGNGTRVTRPSEKVVPYLGPGERSGHDIAVAVDIDAGVAIEEFASRTHVIASEAKSPERLLVRLSPRDSIPNKDFVLRYRVTGGAIKSSLLTHRDERGGYFTLMLYPPKELASLPRHPMEMVFVLDCSGSMNGRPIEQAKAAIERGLRLLQPHDTFQLINFSVSARQFGSKPVSATPENIRKALAHLKSLESEGGTMMIEGVKAALDFPHDDERLRFVCFMTDGYIGNEAQILGEVQKRLGDSRIFSFGVGTSVNRFLLDHMAKLGRGAVAYLNLNDSAADVMDRFFARISHPAMTDLHIDWGGLKVSEVYPAHLPDLFVGRPVILTGRFEGKGRETIRMKGKTGRRDTEIQLPVNSSDGSATHPGLASVWARLKIADLADRATFDANEGLPVAIKRVALDYSLMSSFTAFVAVDSSRRTEGVQGVTVPVAVPVPDGVKYDTTVSER